MDIQPSNPTTHVFAFEGFAGHPSDVPMWSYSFVEDWKDVVCSHFANVSWNYYSQRTSGIHKAIQRCDALVESDPIVVLGFSNGGHAAIQFVASVSQTRLQIPLVFTCDPIKQWRYWLTPDSKVFVRNENVDRWVNLYQRTDTKSIAGLFPAKGNAIIGADVNTEVVDLGPKAHTRLPASQPFLSAVILELTAIGLKKRTAIE